MRVDKLTTRFQEALAEAQSLAVTRDNPYIEPAHVLGAMLAQDEGPKALLERAGVKVPALKAAVDAILTGLPQVQQGMIRVDGQPGHGIELLPDLHERPDAIRRIARNA